MRRWSFRIIYIWCCRGTLEIYWGRCFISRAMGRNVTHRGMDKVRDYVALYMIYSLNHAAKLR